MEYIKKNKFKDKIIAKVTLEDRFDRILAREVHCCLYLEYKQKKKRFGLRKPIITLELFEIHREVKLVEDVNDWNEMDFENWVDKVVQNNEEATENRRKSDKVRELIRGEL